MEPTIEYTDSVMPSRRISESSVKSISADNEVKKITTPNMTLGMPSEMSSSKYSNIKIRTERAGNKATNDQILEPYPELATMQITF